MSAVLIIDDSRTMRAQTATALREAHMDVATLEAQDPVEALRVLLAHPVDLVLCDLEMPRGGGHLLLRLVRERPELADLPVIMVTSRDEAPSRLLCLQLGAADYVARPFQPAELAARVGVHLRAKRLRDQLEQKNRELEALSRMDPLTELANRRALMDGLEREFARASRHGRSLSVCMLDIDHFKSVNDNHGHAVGDRVLVETAKTLTRQLRVHDLVGRYGGEEFVVVLGDTDLAGARILAERLRGAVAAMEIEIEGVRLPITASFGVSERQPDETEIDVLLRRADGALYEAKHRGRNRVVAVDGSGLAHPRVA
jgi:two-component system, cell cycle response regulator